jgi:DNA topoisomerase I
MRACQDLPGQDLLPYVDDAGAIRDVASDDVNASLREISGEDFSAKDFRTWAGTVLAATALKELSSFDSAAQAMKNVRAAIERGATRLGNTPAICRKCYVQPEILTRCLDGRLAKAVTEGIEEEMREELASLAPEDAAVLAMLRARLGGRRDAG